MRAVLAAAIVAASIAGCVVEPLDLEGRRCPCVDGWVCDTARDTCVRAIADGGIDAARDAGAIDARIADAPPEDAPISDAPIADAPPTPVDARPDAPRDAGTDARPFDAGPPPPPSLCGTTHAARLFCDGFDGTPFDAWDTVEVPRGMLTRVTDRVYRGTGALRAEALMGSDRARVTASVFPTAPAPRDQWMRAYWYVEGSASLWFEIQEMFGPDDNLVSLISPDDVDVHAHGFLGDRRDMAGMGGFPTDRWVCVETHIRFGATDGMLELYVDGTYFVGRTMLDSTTPTGLPSIAVGVVWKDVDEGTRVVYVDEVVADTSRIGCDP